MMKKLKRSIKSFFVALALSFSAIFAFAGCSGSTAIKGIHMSNEETISVPYGNFSYEGIGVVVEFANGGSTEISLEEDMIPEYEKTKFFKMGDQEVRVVYRQRFETTMNINVVLNKFNDVYALEGYECVYDGLPHAVKLNHELPEGATVTYPYGNVFSNAGTYEITAVLAKRGYETKTLTATLKIHHADKDMSGVVFEDATFIYTGEIKKIEATNIPEGVTVEYEYRTYSETGSGTKVNSATNAGKYRVIAHFTDENLNYNKIPDKEAILTIEKANYDISKVVLEDVTKEYDGEKYNASIDKKLLPTGVSVSFKYLNEAGEEVSSNANVGKYTIVAGFNIPDALNYNPIEPLTATLTVSKKLTRIKDMITFESKNVNFDENVVQKLEISVNGTLPSTVQVEYENNEQKYAGEYLAKAKFTSTDPNEALDVDELIAYLVINRVRTAVKVLDDSTQQYTKDFSDKNLVVNKPNVTITGYQTNVFNVTSVRFFDLGSRNKIDVNNLENGKQYEYIVSFEYIDVNLRNSTILSDESGLFTYVEA